MRLCARSLYRAPAFAALPPFSRMHVLDLVGGVLWLGAFWLVCPVSQRSILFWLPKTASLKLCERHARKRSMSDATLDQQPSVLMVRRSQRAQTGSCATFPSHHLRSHALPAPVSMRPLPYYATAAQVVLCADRLCETVGGGPGGVEPGGAEPGAQWLLFGIMLLPVQMPRVRSLCHFIFFVSRLTILLLACRGIFRLAQRLRGVLDRSGGQRSRSGDRHFPSEL